MCGRFVQAADPEVYAEVFAVDRILGPDRSASYNVAPTDPVYAVAEVGGERVLATLSWGLVPWWAKDRRAAARTINARVESVVTKPAFRDSFADRRCLVPADGFYEWQPRPAGKLPHYVHPTGGRPLAFAGLWSSWKDPATGARVRTCAIVTGPPNETVAPIHDRMPVIMAEPAWSTWLDPAVGDPDVLLPLLDVAPSLSIAAHPVSTLVNSVANDVPELTEPLTTPAADPLPLETSAP